MKKPLVILFLATALTGCLSTTEKTTTNADAVTFIVINDTYRADNLPYVRSLRTELEKTEGDVLILHAGDILFPSLLSQRYNGAQMIDAMNLLDGDAAASDKHLFIAFGNHEFDKGKLEHAAILQSRIDESQFDWLGTNIVFARDASGHKLVDSKNLVDAKLLTANDIKLGLLSVTTAMSSPKYVERFLSSVETVRDQARQLRAQGAQLVVAVTHQTVTEDKELLSALGNDAPDFIAGGHEHDRQHEVVNGRHVVKADADARSAAIVRISLQNAPQTEVRYITFPDHYIADPAMSQRVVDWQIRFDQETCTEQKASKDCMQGIVGKTRTALVAEELTIRRFETNLGDLLADTARNAYAQQGAQIAFLNSGSMRLNYNISPGNITRTHIDTLFAYPARLAMVKITGKQLQQIVDHAITDWTGNGRWLQISGFAFRHDPAAQTASNLSLVTAQGLRPLHSDETLLAVTNEYLLDEKGDQDGYRMLNQGLIVSSPPAVDLKQELLKTLAQNLDNGIAPEVDGRICNLQRTSTCPLF
jgi:2',3'-cyclic-nucleotide 2'-phosphodiesterase (5'-nucleotidase family)